MFAGSRATCCHHRRPCQLPYRGQGLAAIAGLAPVPRDSGRIRGTLKRTRSYDRRLLRVFYLAAYNSIRTSSKSRAYYDRKRAEGKHHTQAILSLARRRLNVLWAMQRDDTSYRPV
jgi:transposase